MSHPDRYCVFGNPISHSKSPQIHAAFARQCADSIRYDKTLVELGDFEKTARAFFSSGGMGANVTVPFKKDAYRFADHVTERARLAGALNTLKLMDDGSIYGDTTDGSGLIWDLCQRLQWNLRGERLLVLGAGGAATSVMLDLLNQDPVSVTIANRTLSKAEAIADKFSDFGHIDASSYDSIAIESGFSIVINATSASLSGALPPLPEALFAREPKVYDMVYADKPTAFLEYAKTMGAVEVSDGLGMLIGQAAESYTIWRNKKPKPAEVIEDWRS
jgi:shikimate dehydrogenase